MKHLLIVYHSRTGGSRQMAEAAAQAVRAQAGVTVHLKAAPDAGPEDLLAADGYLFACPENLAALSGVMKDFFDRCYYPVLDRLNGRPYAAMVCAGSDGSNAVRQLERIATGWRLNRIAPSLIVCTHAQTPQQILAPKTIGANALAQCADLGEGLAVGMEAGIFYFTMTPARHYAGLRPSQMQQVYQ